MSPTIDFIDIGDVVKSEVSRGVIETIDSDTDTCAVNIDGVTSEALIFYH